MSRYDVAIIGSGPAGAEAAINLKIRNKKFILFGSPDISKKVTAASRIDNYLGLPGISGKELKERMQDHLKQMEIEISPQQIQMIYQMGDYYSLSAGQEVLEATAVILATGAFSSKMLAGEEEFLGRGVSYCATCDAPLYRGRTVAVLGYSEEAVFEANYIAELAGKVYYVPVKEAKSSLADQVEVVTGKVQGVEGDTVLRSLIFEDKTIEVDGVFILREMVAPSSLMPGIKIEKGYIKVDENMATNLPGCFAAGDCTGRPHQYMRAAGQGQTAALSVLDYLNERL